MLITVIGDKKDDREFARGLIANGTRTFKNSNVYKGNPMQPEDLYEETTTR